MSIFHTPMSITCTASEDSRVRKEGYLFKESKWREKTNKDCDDSSPRTTQLSPCINHLSMGNMSPLESQLFVLNDYWKEEITDKHAFIDEESENGAFWKCMNYYYHNRDIMVGGEWIFDEQECRLCGINRENKGDAVESIDSTKECVDILSTDQLKQCEDIKKEKLYDTIKCDWNNSINKVYFYGMEVLAITDIIKHIHEKNGGKWISYRDYMSVLLYFERIIEQTRHQRFNLEDMENKENQCPYDVKKVLRMKGYVNLSQIAKTLQGAIYRAKQCDNDRTQNNSENERETESKTDSNGKSVVIKVTDKRLHEKSVALVDGKEIPIQENIVDEIRILRWLTRHHPPPAMTRYIDCFEDEKNIFLIMEDGGMDFFKFVAECHKLINSGLLSINEWQCAVKVLFKQMIEFINWMHSKMAICHLDISLENLLITDVFVMSDHGANGKQHIYLSHNFQIKFCDFGLSTAFDGKDYRCNKYVGKTGYKAPKVYGKKKIFDARAADVWSLGIVLFMMVIGAPPFKRPSKKEYGFELIISGKMNELIESWGRLDYLTPPMFDLLNKMLQREETRITMKEIRRHPWLR